MAQSGVLIADQQALTAAGLSKILQDTEPVYIRQVHSTADLLESLTTDRFDRLFIDYHQFPGFQIREFDKLSDTFPGLKIAVISDDRDHHTILEVLKKEILVFLTKSCDEDEIKMAYRAMLRGEKFFCNKILNILLQTKTAAKAGNSNTSSLTDREQEVLRLIALGNSTQTIADQLHLSPHTISTHRKNIIKKLCIKSPTEFVVHAIDLRLVDF